MLRFDKVTVYLPLLLSVSLNTKTWYSEVLLLSEFIKIVSILYYGFKNQVQRTFILLLI